MGIFPFNRNKYARELNCRERYHTRELMLFHFIFVANIRDKNPLYGKLHCTDLSTLTSLFYSGPAADQFLNIKIILINYMHII